MQTGQAGVRTAAHPGRPPASTTVRYHGEPWVSAATETEEDRAQYLLDAQQRGGGGCRGKEEKGIKKGDRQVGPLQCQEEPTACSFG